MLSIRNGDHLHGLVAFMQHCVNVTEFINVLVIIHFQKTEMLLNFIFNKSLLTKCFIFIFINTRWRSKCAKTVYKVYFTWTAVPHCHTAVPLCHTAVPHCGATLRCNTAVPHYRAAILPHRGAPLPHNVVRPVAKGGHFGAVPPRWSGVPPRWMFPLNVYHWVPPRSIAPDECPPVSAPPRWVPPRWMPSAECPLAADYPPRFRKTSPTTPSLEFLKLRRLPPLEFVKLRS